jgi:hypothetical protein
MCSEVSQSRWSRLRVTTYFVAFLNAFAIELSPWFGQHSFDGWFPLLQNRSFGSCGCYARPFAASPFRATLSWRLRREPYFT